MTRKSTTDRKEKKIDEEAVKRAQQLLSFYGDRLYKGGGGIPLTTAGLLYDIKQYFHANDMDLNEIEIEAGKRFTEFLIG